MLHNGTSNIVLLNTILLITIKPLEIQKNELVKAVLYFDNFVRILLLSINFFKTEHISIATSIDSCYSVTPSHSPSSDLIYNNVLFFK